MKSLITAGLVFFALTAFADDAQDDRPQFAGGAQDLLGYTKPLKKDGDEAIQEGKDRNAEATRPPITPLSGPNHVAPNVALPTNWSPSTR